jgi:hypothetical protein
MLHRDWPYNELSARRYCGPTVHVGSGFDVLALTVTMAWLEISI